jgi:hypothetical protein
VKAPMNRVLFCIAFFLGLMLTVSSGWVHAYQTSEAVVAVVGQPTTQPEAPTEENAIQQLAAQPSQNDNSDLENSKLEAFDKVIKNTQKLDGLFTLYRQKGSGKLFAEINPTQLNRNFLCTMTLESGIGEFGLYRGLPIGDFLFTLRRVNNNLQFVIPNVYFRTRLGDPTPRNLDRSFSDSTLYALPIKSIHPQRKTFLVDLEPLLLSDSPGLTPLLQELSQVSYKLDSNKSYFGKAKAFPLNVELESTYGFSFAGGDNLPDIVTLPDSRAFSLSVRYSLSQLPGNNGYRPRLADDRVGYFITAYQDLSNDEARDPFVRYINRWHLEKQNPSAPLSPPKEPIVFWIENTVPVEYRDTVRDGILMWNRAFEKIGFKDAIQVKQMPQNATWDPADVRYNTIRWFNALDAGFAMGPSRVNPLTGEILDADIMVDASFVRYIKQDYRTLAESESAILAPFWFRLTGDPNLCSPSNAVSYLRQKVRAAGETRRPERQVNLASKGFESDLCYGAAATQQFAVGSLTLSMFRNTLPNSEDMKQYVQQFLRELIAHEVGHTLGLRHNFHASAMLKPDELNNTDITRNKGLVASVMDYAAVNLAPEGMKQGDFFTPVVGPYDEWAIAYGYTPSDAIVPQQEISMLEKIAKRAPETELSYATDEDVFGGLDPQVNAFDLSGDVLTYGQWQMANARKLWEKLDKRYPNRGERYSDVRVMFDRVFGYYANYAYFLTNYIGGQSFNRFRAGDAPGKLPFTVVPIAQQREALALIQKQVFDDANFQFSPELLNKLAPSRWMHWAQTPSIFGLDYPIHERVLLLQSLVLSDLLSSDRLNRLRNNELKAAPNEALTLPELFDTLQAGIWTEVIKPDQKTVQISSLRRSLQRQYLNTLINMALRNPDAAAKAQTLPDLLLALRTSDVPEDARTLAWYELKQLRESLRSTLRKRGDGMNTYTRAHLEEAHDRLSKALDARFQVQ